jgi:hypothetical protein
MEKYNLEMLIKVKVRDFIKTGLIIYKKRNKWFGVKEGFYKQLLGSSFIGKNCPDNCTFKDGSVYCNPMVTLYYQSNIEKHYYFKTLKEAENFAKGLTDKSNWI